MYRASTHMSVQPPKHHHRSCDQISDTQPKHFAAAGDCWSVAPVVRTAAQIVCSTQPSPLHTNTTHTAVHMLQFQHDTRSATLLHPPPFFTAPSSGHQQPTITHHRHPTHSTHHHHPCEPPLACVLACCNSAATTAAVTAAAARCSVRPAAQLLLSCWLVGALGSRARCPWHTPRWSCRC